jgi:hypothetical protein
MRSHYTARSRSVKRYKLLATENNSLEGMLNPYCRNAEKVPVAIKLWAAKRAIVQKLGRYNPLAPQSYRQHGASET